jgi:hypothetical protein
MKKMDGSECGFYPVIFPKKADDNNSLYLFSFKRREVANRAKIWNTVTDKSVISGANGTDSFTNFSFHNSFSQTNPLRMFDALVWQAKFTPTFNADTNSSAIELVRKNVANKSNFDAHLESCVSK